MQNQSTALQCKIIDYPSDKDWLKIRNDFLVSHRKESVVPPSETLKMKYLASGHTPLYGLQITWEWQNLPYWISVHMTRHSIGIHHIVSSQRNDIQREYNRKKAPQDSPVNHRCVANAVSIINVSQKRLCLTASSETRLAWEMLLHELDKVCPEIVKFCVKPCVFRNGICPEVFSDCRWNHTPKFQEDLEEYRRLFKV